MKFLKLVPFALLLAACNSGVDVEELEKKEANAIFNMGKEALEKKQYAQAAKIFEAFEKQHPYSALSPQAELYLAHSYYSNGKLDEASSTYSIFIRTHPTHKEVPYALYMLGVIEYEQIPIVERDQEPTIRALRYFNELVMTYPNSQYAADSKVKIKLLREHLAGREIYVAKYYQSKNNYAAAINRLNTVVEFYKDTIHIEEALHRLVECYTSMGLFDEASNIYSILKQHYSKSKWTGYSKALVEPKKQTKK